MSTTTEGSHSSPVFMNKLFEVLLWERIKFGWEDQGVISRLQGACKKGSSCLHLFALILHESVAVGLGTLKESLCLLFWRPKGFWMNEWFLKGTSAYKGHLVP